MFHLAYPLIGLRRATYNPRSIDADALETLAESMRVIGFCKPVIVTHSGLLVAGHQRTTIASRLGLTTVPAWVLSATTEADEVRFNQLHNGSDLDICDQPVRVPASTALGFEEVEAAAIDCNTRSQGAAIRSEICRLVVAYGGWGCAVATQAGEVISSPQYAIAMHILQRPCRVYRIPDTLAAEARGFLGQTYGRFSYDHLPRRTWIQTFAQPRRLRSEAKGGSTLYDHLVIPTLRPGDRVLDFGCGQADYVRELRRRGHAIFGIEFYHRTGVMLDLKATRALVDDALLEWGRRGPFDVVVCDAVITSVNTRQAEADVMTMVNAFAKVGARVFFSGRSREAVDGSMRSTQAVSADHHRRYVEFLDEDGFSGMLHRGDWFFQKFHRREDALALASRFLGGPAKYSTIAGRSMWQVATSKMRELPARDVEDALRREFDLPWPEGRSVGRASSALAAWRSAQTLRR